MKRSFMILAITFLSIVILSAQIHRDPPPFNVSVNPTLIMPSWYDYMIGGYNATPVQVIPDVLGGGVLMAFHAKSTNVTTRSDYLAYVDVNGLLQSVTHISATGGWSGYPLLDFDDQSGLAFMAWHEEVGTDILYSVHGAFGIFINGELDTLSTPHLIFCPSAMGDEYTWPIVKFGPSPIPGMRRIYVLAKKSVTNTYPIEVPKIAYTDFNPDLVNQTTILNWNYISVPELEAWSIDPATYRRYHFTMAVGNNGSIYLCGYHEARNINPEYTINEPNLDVFVCDNYGTSPWRRITISAQQSPSCQTQPITGTMYADVSNSVHFNAVIGDNDNIQFPQLYTYKLQDGDLIYTHPTMHALRHIEFNTSTETININDLYPLGASPHSAPAYTPWDINEDCLVDSVDNQGYALFPTHWPFPYWDQSASSDAMFYHYNLQMMTEPNEQGWMACVWQDCNRARLYNEFPVDYPQYLDYADTPEIFISLSPDNGFTWMEPIVLNNITTPFMENIKPMWVYPANKISFLNNTDSTGFGRLYLMFYDDNFWFSESLELAPMPHQGGNVMYMAIDITMPVTANDDPVNTPAVVSLEQNYPNPFKNCTTIKYSLAKDSDVKLDIYNAKGQLVKNLAQGKAKAGVNTLTWNGVDTNGKKVSTGLYFYKLQSEGQTLTKKLLLIK